MSGKIETRNVKIYNSVNNTKQYIFPEQNKNVDPNKLAISISGGGPRSFSTSTGHLRCLNRNKMLTNEKISYISSISGGSWISSIFTFSKVDKEELLGESINVEDISRRTLNYTNFEKEDKFIGNVMNQCPFQDLLSEYLRLGFQHDKIWENILSTIFLKPYNLNNKIPVESEEKVTLYKELYNIDCVAPREDAPFYISFSSTLSMDENIDKIDLCDFSLLEFTPMYSGIKVPKFLYGGVYLENIGFGCVYEPKHIDILENSENIENEGINTEIQIHEIRKNTLASMMGSSSAAYGIALVTNKLLSKITNLKSMTSIVNVWGKNSKENHRLFSIDGGFNDFTGVISLAARNCKKVLAFLNIEKGNRDHNGKINYCDYGMTHLFSTEKCYRCERYESRDKFGIFSTEDWELIKQDYEDRIDRGELAYFKRRMRVLQNKFAGVNGGYDMEIIFLPLVRNKKFEDRLKVDLDSDIFPELNNFTELKTVFADGLSSIELTNSQINLMSTYGDWCLEELMKAEPEFFL